MGKKHLGIVDKEELAEPKRNCFPFLKKENRLYLSLSAFLFIMNYKISECLSFR